MFCDKPYHAVIFMVLQHTPALWLYVGSILDTEVERGPLLYSTRDPHSELPLLPVYGNFLLRLPLKQESSGGRCLGSGDIVNSTRGRNPSFDMSLLICGGEVGGR